MGTIVTALLQGLHSSASPGFSELSRSVSAVPGDFAVSSCDCTSDVISGASSRSHATDAARFLPFLFAPLTFFGAILILK